jgi:hypothetical protein
VCGAQSVTFRVFGGTQAVLGAWSYAIKRISSRGQTTRGGSPAWGLGVGLTTLHHKNKLVTKNLTEPRTWTGRPRRMWVDNIKRDLGEVGWGDVDWIGVAQDRNRWRALVNSVLNFRVP